MRAAWRFVSILIAFGIAGCEGRQSATASTPEEPLAVAQPGAQLDAPDTVAEAPAVPAGVQPRYSTPHLRLRHRRALPR